MYLSRLQVRGFRASANQPMDVSLPGRFAVLLGANSAARPHLPRARASRIRRSFRTRLARRRKP
jgi:hypothetical protein